MARSFRASKEGIEKATQAFNRKGWTQEYLATVVPCSRPTVGNFFAGRPVDKSCFQEICNKLGCNWEDIADFDSAEEKEPSQPLNMNNLEQTAEANACEFDQQQPQGDNPFEYGPPVLPQRFYGRKKEILEIKNRIGAISPQCVNLVGLRRNGKTSLLRYIKERISEFCSPEQKPLVVALDLTNGNFHNPEGIIEGLRRGIHKVTGNFPWSKEDNEDGFVVEDGLQALVDERYRLIILLDEFEAIASTKDRLELFQNWGADWRSKGSAGLLTMVIASKRPLDKVYETLSLGSPFANIFSTTILGALEEEAWQGIICKGFSPDSALLKWVDELTGGLPYYVQMVGAMLWQYRNQETARNEFSFQAKPRFEELWKDLTEVERLALRYGLEGGNLPIPEPAIVDRLQRHGLLRKDGSLFSSVFAEFVKGQK